MRPRRRTLWLTLIPLLLVVALMFGLFWLSGRPADLGPENGQLRPCPDSPNCVCSYDSGQQHGIAPIDAGDDPAATLNRLRTLLQSMPRVRIVTDEGGYLHAKFTTPLMRYVDDVEFLLDSQAGVIQVRSASRVGYSDLGANRKRVETLRALVQTD